MHPSPPDTAAFAEHFRWLLPTDRHWFSTAEVARLLHVSPQTVRDAFDNQKILGHRTNASARRGHEQRRHHKITRDAIILYLAESANYEPSDLYDHLEALFHRRSLAELDAIETRLRNVRAKQQARRHAHHGNR